jgi:hypothetical protein
MYGGHAGGSFVVCGRNGVSRSSGLIAVRLTFGGTF